MPTQTLDPALQKFLQGRHIATLGTENSDGSIHLTAVWYLFESGALYVATSSKTQKARNVAARPKASLMVDARKPGTERGVTAAGRVDVLSGEQSKEINRRIHSRYLSAAAISDPHVGAVFASFDDVTYDSRPFHGSRGTWQYWTPNSLEADSAGHPDTSCRSIDARRDVLMESQPDARYFHTSVMGVAVAVRPRCASSYMSSIVRSTL